MRWLQRGFLALLAAALAGCAATRLRSTWDDPADSGVPLARVAVMVVDDDANLRRFAEDQASRALSGQTTLVPAYRLFEQPEPDVAKVRERLVAEGYDGILLARKVAVDRTRHWVPPRTVAVPSGPLLLGPYLGPRGFEGYYRHAWFYAYETLPGYETTRTTVVVETVLYRLPEGRAIWSAVSETRDPESAAEVVHDLVELVGDELAGRALLGRRD